MKRLKAFTLMELLVAMLISTIVVGISYQAYHIVYQQYMSYRKNNQLINNVFMLHTALQTDFMNAKFVNKKEDAVVMKDKDGNKIIYFFDQNYILRNVNEMQDTFFVSANDMHLKFISEDQKATEGIIDEFYFTSLVAGEEEHFHFSKTYAADVLMEAEKEHFLQKN